MGNVAIVHMVVFYSLKCNRVCNWCFSPHYFSSIWSSGVVHWYTSV